MRRSASLPRAQQDAIDPDQSFELIRRHVIAYVRDDLLTAEINAFDAALALLALAKLGAPSREPSHRRCPASRARSARAAAAGPTRPTSGTR